MGIGSGSLIRYMPMKNNIYPDLEPLHPKNLNWLKAIRWGTLLHSKDDMNFYLWDDKLYVVSAYNNKNEADLKD